MEGPREKPKSRGGFKGFMKSLTKDLRNQDRRGSSVDLTATTATRHVLQRETTATSTTSNLTTSQNNNSSNNNASNTASSTLPLPAKPEPLGEATELAVHVSLTFEEPLDFSYSRIYEGSPAFRASDAVCQGLLHRVDHCCQELITRKDPVALDRTNPNDGTGKPLRFEICTDIIRGSETWASRTYKSYQKQPLTGDGARDVTLSAHQIIGLFMRQHDDGFVWKDGPFREEPLPTQETFAYRPGRVQPLTCVPRNLFLEKSQAFERMPGYSMQVEITSKNQLPKPREWQKLIEVNSAQGTPLDAASGEDLFFEASYAVEGILRDARRAFAQRHLDCNSSRRCARCRPHDGDGLELKITVTNNIGPRFEHLNRTIRSNLGGFLVDADAVETVDLLNAVESACHKLRIEVDRNMSQRNDLEFNITELRGRGWILDEPLSFTIGADKSNCRRDTEAILDRVQTGLASVLRGNALKVRMTAHKRGHFIMDKTLVAREPFEASTSSTMSSQMMKKPKPNDKSRAYVVDCLQKQINKDIEMVCRDTCTVVEPEEEPEMSPQPAAVSDNAGTREAGNQAGGIVGQAVSTESPSTTGEAREENRRPDPRKRANTIGSLLSLSLLDNDELTAVDSSAQSDTNQSDNTSRRRSSLDMTRPSPVARRSTRVVRDPDTGARRFPLVTYGDRYSGVDEAVLDTHDDLVANQGTRTGTPMTATEVSTTPSTPSLVAGDGPSTPSSIIVTPRLHESFRHDTQKHEGSFEGSDVEDIGTRHEHNTVSGRSRVAAPRLAHVTSVSTEYRIPTSPLHKEESAPQSLDSAAILITSPSKTDEQQSPTLPEARPAHDVYEDDGFSQSKPDFDFSSPTPISPLSNASDIEHHQSIPALALDTSPQRPPPMSKLDTQHQYHTLPRTKQRSTATATDASSSFDATEMSSIHDDLDDDDGIDGVDDDNEQAIESGPPSPARSTSSRPSTSSGLLGRSPSGTFNRPPHQHRKSLGSAGFLGSFRDDRVAEIIGLRKALMLSPPGVPPVPPVPSRHLGTRSLSVDATKLFMRSGGGGGGAVDGAANDVRPGTSAGAVHGPTSGEHDDDAGGVPLVPAIPVLVTSKSE
ncbi:hypothetical protein Micbo1qcDRAFT_28991 [Microdochium bolleyi]|uniref:Pt repeat family protein n=1 Tax=Microdochium bolleyi TaxID=196109 RepID=A0A136JF91_9PEZI|nr:hypothetical protein Micbo1qcDRAFT_28991 [Microdochium bolleyi]